MEVRKFIVFGARLCFCFHRRKKAIDSFKIKKKRSDLTEEDLLEILAADLKVEIRKNYKTGDIYADLYMRTAPRLNDTQILLAPNPHDILLHAMFSYSMDRDLYSS